MRKIFLPLIILLSGAQAADVPFYIKEWAHANNKYIVGGKIVDAPVARKPAAPKKTPAAPKKAVVAKTPPPKPASPKPVVRAASLTGVAVHDVTFYQAVSGQTDSTPNISACGATKSPWAQVAVSRDMFRSKYRCGQVVKVTLNRPVAGVTTFVAVVNDTMSPRFTNRVDVLVGKNEPAMRYGKTTATITKLN